MNTITAAQVVTAGYAVLLVLLVAGLASVKRPIIIGTSVVAGYIVTLACIYLVEGDTNPLFIAACLMGVVHLPAVKYGWQKTAIANGCITVLLLAGAMPVVMLIMVLGAIMTTLQAASPRQWAYMRHFYFKEDNA